LGKYGGATHPECEAHPVAFCGELPVPLESLNTWSVEEAFAERCLAARPRGTGCAVCNRCSGAGPLPDGSFIEAPGEGSRHECREYGGAACESLRSMGDGEWREVQSEIARRTEQECLAVEDMGDMGCLVCNKCGKAITLPGHVWMRPPPRGSDLGFVCELFDGWDSPCLAIDHQQVLDNYAAWQVSQRFGPECLAYSAEESLLCNRCLSAGLAVPDVALEGEYSCRRCDDGECQALVGDAHRFRTPPDFETSCVAAAETASACVLCNRCDVAGALSTARGRSWRLLPGRGASAASSGCTSASGSANKPPSPLRRAHGRTPKAWTPSGPSSSATRTTVATRRAPLKRNAIERLPRDYLGSGQEELQRMECAGPSSHGLSCLRRYMGAPRRAPRIL